jgi:hypothetical protein
MPRDDVPALDGVERDDDDEFDRALDYARQYMAARATIARRSTIGPPFEPPRGRHPLGGAHAETPWSPPAFLDARLRPRSTTASRCRAVLALPRPSVPPYYVRPQPLHVRLGPPQSPRTTTPRVPVGTLAPWARKKEMHDMDPRMEVCKQGHAVTPGAKFCGKCGTAVRPGGPLCRACGQPLKARHQAGPRARALADQDDTLDAEFAGERLFPGVDDIAADQLLFKATLVDRGPDKLSTVDLGKLEAYCNDGLGLFAIAARDPSLAMRTYRAVTPMGA